MKLLHLEIEECRKCPYIRPAGAHEWCDHEKFKGAEFDNRRWILASGIPDWCPLPNAEENR